MTCLFYSLSGSFRPPNSTVPDLFYPDFYLSLSVSLASLSALKVLAVLPKPPANDLSSYIFDAAVLLVS